MAMIGLQLFTGQRIDVDAETDFSLKSSNPFFCVGINELSHTQDFSVPATKKNNLIFNVDNSVIADGWRRGRGCWLIYSAGEIEGKLYIKDHNNGRYNVLFIWGSELDDILTQPVSSYLASALDIYIQGPKPSDRVDDFGWVNYNEVHYDPSFNDGMSLSPAVNLGWLMSKSAQQAGYNIRIDGQAFAFQAAQYNPNNYGFTLDRCESGTLYHLGFGGFAADITSGRWNNYQLFDDNNNPVALSAGGLYYQSRPLPTTSPGNLVMCLCFTATRQVRLRLTPDSSVIVLSINGNSVSTEGNGGQFPYVEYNEYLTLSAGQAFTILHANDFDLYTWSVKNNGYTTPVTYSIDVTDSMTTASVGDVVYLDSNLPDKSLLDLVRDWCLISSSYFEIDPDTKTINIYTIEKVVARGISNNIIDIDSGQRDILAVGSLRRYIDGFSQHNNTVCDSADYVSEVNRYRADYPCDNDLLDESSDFGVIGFNDGNIIGDGEAVFDNFQPLNGGGVEMKASCGIFFFDPNGGPAKHLQWVENNYGMHNTMEGITSQAVSIVVTIRETMMQYLSHNSTQLWQYGGCLWVAKDYTWKGNATQMTLVKVDNAMALAFSPIDYLRFTGNGTIYLTSTATVAPVLEYSFDGHHFVEWPHYTAGFTHTFDTLTIDDDVTIFVRGNNERMRYSQFFMTGTIYADGDVGTLIDGVGGADVTIQTHTFMQLFMGCASLKTAPKIEAISTNTSCYTGMFRDCTGIEEAPTLHAINVAERAYNNMFNGCSSLQKVKIYAETLGPDALTYWLYGVNPSGQLTCPQSLVIPSGYYQLPAGWTRVNL